MPQRALNYAILALSLAASAPAAERWTHYTDYTGISTLADAGRHLWLGTRGGLIRMDKATGARSYFNQANSALTDPRILAMDADGNGRMAAVTLGGSLTEFDGNHWHNLGLLAPFQKQRVVDVAWGSQATLWVLAVDEQSRLPSVFLRRNAGWIRLYLEGVDPISLPGVGAYGSGAYGYSYGGFGYGYYGSSLLPSVQADGDGRIWVTVRYQGQPKLISLTADGAMDSMPVPTHLYPRQFVASRSGSAYWICMRGIAWPDSQGWDSTTFPAGTYAYQRASHPRHAFARDADGSELWALPQLYRRRGSVWESVTPPDDSLRTSGLLLEAGGGDPLEAPHLYLAGSNRIASWNGVAWSVSNPAQVSLGIGALRHLVRRAPGSPEALVGGTSEVLALDARTSRFAPLDLKSNWRLPLYGLAADRHGRIWLSFRGSLGRLGPDGLESLVPPDGRWTGYSGALSGSTRFLAEDASGKVWMADSSRLLAITPPGSGSADWITHPLPEPWDSATYVTALGSHPDGSLWMAARRPYPYAWIIARYSGKVWTVFDSLKLPGPANNPVRDLRCDGAGNVWAPTGQGILQWNGTVWRQHLWSSHPLLGRGIVATAMDGNGNLWTATAPPEASLLRWSNGWQAVADAGTGMASTLVRTMEFDGTGRLWMTTAEDGVLIYDPSGTAPTVNRADPGRRYPGQARFSLARLADGRWRLSPGPLAGRGPSELRILDLKGAVLSGIEVRLIPSDGGSWTWAGPGRRLPPGKYLLSLRGGPGAGTVLPFLHGLP